MMMYRDGIFIPHQYLQIDPVLHACIRQLAKYYTITDPKFIKFVQIVDRTLGNNDWLQKAPTFISDILPPYKPGSDKHRSAVRHLLQNYTRISNSKNKKEYMESKGALRMSDH